MSADISDEERFDYYRRVTQLLEDRLKMGYERNSRLVTHNDHMRACLAAIREKYQQWDQSRTVGVWKEEPTTLAVLAAIGDLLNDNFPVEVPKHWDAGGRDEYFDQLDKDALTKADAKVLAAAAACEFTEYDSQHLICETADAPLSTAEWERRELKKQIEELKGKKT